MTPLGGDLVGQASRLSESATGETPVPSCRWWWKCLGWCVHFYTALGLIAAAMIAVLLVRGDADAYRRCFLLMVVAVLIDATDGTFARRIRIKEVVPSFDGRRLDDLVDFLTYTCLPLVLIWRARLLPESCDVCLLLPLMASAYGFCQVSAKTEDGYFLGFPSYWNLVAFYLYTLQPLSGWFALAIVIVLSLLTFVPSRYLYPTQRGKLNQLTNLLGIAWAVLLVWIIWNMPDNKGGGITLLVVSPEDSPTRGLAVLSLVYPAWYMGASWIVSVRFWRKTRCQTRDHMGAVT